MILHINTERGLEEAVRKKMHGLSPEERPRFDLSKHPGECYCPGYREVLTISPDASYVLESDSSMPHLINLYEVDHFPKGLVIPDHEMRKRLLKTKRPAVRYSSIQILMAPWMLCAYEFAAQFGNYNMTPEKGIDETSLREVFSMSSGFYTEISEKDLERVLQKIDPYLKRWFFDYGHGEEHISNVGIFAINYEKANSYENAKSWLEKRGYKQSEAGRS